MDNPQSPKLRGFVLLPEPKEFRWVRKIHIECCCDVVHFPEPSESSKTQAAKVVINCQDLMSQLFCCVPAARRRMHVKISISPILIFH